MSPKPFFPDVDSERRQHRVFVTRHTEYHLRAGHVVAVRTCGSRAWLSAHDALGMRLEGFVAPGTLVPRLGVPTLGQRLYLARGEDDVVTSPLVAIDRPPKAVVGEYPTAAA